MASTTELGVVYANLGLKGSALAATSYTAALTSATTSLRDYANAQVSATQAAETDSAFATTVMANLGLTASVIGQAAYDALQPALAAYVNSVGAANRGVVVVQLAQIVAGLTADATFGAAAINLNAGAATAYTYSTTAANTTDKVVSLLPTAVNFTLTTGADTPALSTVSDIIDALGVNTLTANDKIIDGVTTDSDVLNAKMNAAAAATIVNVEAVNIEWTSNADMDVVATNMANNGLKLSGSGLAFTGKATVTDAGDNDVTAGTGITSLTLTNIVDSVISAGAASAVTVDKAAAVPTAGQRTTANITANKAAFTITNTTGDQVEVLKVTNTVADAVISVQGAANLTGSGIGTSLAVSGAVNTTVKGVVTGETITNGLTNGKLTVLSTDTGAINLTKVSADLITLSGNGGAVTVAANQNLSVTTGGNVTSLLSGTGLTNVTTNLTTSVGLTTDITDISNLNLTVTKDVTNAFTTDAANNITIAGSGANTMTITGVAAVDASAATGKQSITTSNNNSGIIGATSAVNAIVSNNSTSNLTFIGGTEADTVSLIANTGAIKLTMGAGNDTVTVAGALTGSNAQTIDGGDNTDTLQIDTAAGVAAAGTGSSRVVFSNFEKIVAVDGVIFNNAQLSGSTVALSAQSGNATANVIAFDRAGTATTSTIDLSTLTLGTSTGANFNTINITGLNNSVDTIKGTKANDVIDGQTKGDVIDISQGGADTIVVHDGDSVYASSAADNVDKVTGYNMSSTATIADKIDFDNFQVRANVSSINVKTAITNYVAADAATATITNGILTLAGVNADKIDTLAEYQKAAKLAVETNTESFTLTLPATLVVDDAPGDDTVISFDGTDVELADGDDELDVAAALAAATYTNWTAVDNLDGTVTFTSTSAHVDVVDVVDADFVFDEGVDADTDFTGTVSIDVQGGTANAGDTVAFQFGGNTYVYNYVDGTAGNDNLVALVGVTGAVAVAATAGTNTIFVA